MSGRDPLERVPVSTQVGRLMGHSFLPLADGARVVDLGLNHGEFARAIAAAYGAEIVGCEPHPVLADEVRNLGVDGLSVHELAVAGEPGTIPLFLNETYCATVRPTMREAAAAAVDVPAVTFEQFFEDAIVPVWGEAPVDLLKVDIEAAEIPLLRETPVPILQRFKQITVEFHDFVDESLAVDVEWAKSRLRDIGFVELRFTLNNEDVLFLNERYYRVPSYVAWLLLARFRFVRGTRRRLRRHLVGSEPRDTVPRR